jgi:hypothetical protein
MEEIKLGAPCKKKRNGESDDYIDACQKKGMEKVTKLKRCEYRCMTKLPSNSYSYYRMTNLARDVFWSQINEFYGGP